MRSLISYLRLCSEENRTSPSFPSTSSLSVDLFSLSTPCSLTAFPIHILVDHLQLFARTFPWQASTPRTTSPYTRSIATPVVPGYPRYPMRPREKTRPDQPHLLLQPI